MIYSGADLIKSAPADRVAQLKLVRPKGDAEKPGFDHDSESALFRFARFVRKEKDQKKSPPKPIKRIHGVPIAYAAQIQALQETQNVGGMLDIYV